MNNALATKSLWLIIGVLFVGVASVALYKTWPLIFPDLAYVAELDDSCDLHTGPCTSRVGDNGSVNLSITPKEIPLVKPLEFEVLVQDLTATNVEINFVGVDMNMGFNRFKLSQEQDGKFTGGGMLPVCVLDSMLWEAQVLLTTEQGLISVPYRFVTVRPGFSSSE
jgi:hypothetical protein